MTNILLYSNLFLSKTKNNRFFNHKLTGSTIFFVRDQNVPSLLIITLHWEEALSHNRLIHPSSMLWFPITYWLIPQYILPTKGKLWNYCVENSLLRHISASFC